jgi:hypothetical protein
MCWHWLAGLPRGVGWGAVLAFKAFMEMCIGIALEYLVYGNKLSVYVHNDGTQ